MMFSLPEAEWTRHGRMKVARRVDPDLLRRVYLELVRIEKAATAARSES